MTYEDTEPNDMRTQYLMTYEDTGLNDIRGVSEKFPNVWHKNFPVLP
jgi:hypothetical protein